MANRAGQVGASRMLAWSSSASDAEHVRGRHIDVGQLAGRQAEQRPRAERLERELDA